MSHAVTGRIELRDISFRYADTEPEVGPCTTCRRVGAVAASAYGENPAKAQAPLADALVTDDDPSRRQVADA